jgi:hypothetical protein
VCVCVLCVCVCVCVWVWVWVGVWCVCVCVCADSGDTGARYTEVAVEEEDMVRSVCGLVSAMSCLSSGTGRANLI